MLAVTVTLVLFMLGLTNALPKKNAFFVLALDSHPQPSTLKIMKMLSTKRINELRAMRGLAPISDGEGGRLPIMKIDIEAPRVHQLAAIARKYKVR